ncbi:MAG: type VI secretion system tube protein Hcp [bacterium]|nr:type VI secretion system tube protein Hcp [bacterium]
MAVDMFLEIEGKKIKGESRDKTHKDSIDVLAWSWGLSQSGTMHVGGGGGAGKVNVQDISVTKYVDKSSPDLAKACCEGKHFKDARLIVRKAGGSPLEYLIIEMEKVLVSSVSTGGSGGEDRLTENVTFNFGKVKYKYQPQKDDGAKDGGVVEMGWDIAENVPV